MNEAITNGNSTHEEVALSCGSLNGKLNGQDETIPSEMKNGIENGVSIDIVDEINVTENGHDKESTEHFEVPEIVEPLFETVEIVKPCAEDVNDEELVLEELVEEASDEVASEEEAAEKAATEEDAAEKIGSEEEEDIPLARLTKTNEIEKEQEVKEERAATPTPVKIGEKLSVLHPYSHVRGRPGLRSGSPLNSSFTVQSEPSSPSGFAFPRLRKADGHISLAVSEPRKRSLDDSNPETSSAKRSRGVWRTLNPLRWWRNEEVPLENAEVDTTTESEPEVEDAPPSRSCLLQ